MHHAPLRCNWTSAQMRDKNQDDSLPHVGTVEFREFKHSLNAYIKRWLIAFYLTRLEKGRQRAICCT